MSGRVEIVIGCMFSGKSTELIRRISRYEAIGHQTLLVNHLLDTRTGKSIKTHSNQERIAMKTNNLLGIMTKPSYKNCKVIGIDEAQFFPDLYQFIIESEKDSKIIIIAGLDGDSNRKPFGQILQCVPLCDEIIKLTAMDMVSKDGTPAIFTKRIVDNNKQILVGAKDYFMAVCRQNY